MQLLLVFIVVGLCRGAHLGHYDSWDTEVFGDARPEAKLARCDANSASEHRRPSFSGVLVEGHFWDSYWTESLDVNNDGRPDLFSSGLFSGEIYWYKNPVDPDAAWERYNVALLDKPVAMEHADVDQDGYTDIIVAYDYGNCIADCDPKQGKVAWLKNPGSYDTGRNWTVNYIGHLMAGHRLKLGNFTGSQKLELMGLPIVGKPMDASAALTLFMPSKNVSKEWKAIPVDDTMHFVHGVVKRPNLRTGFDSLLIAAQEGVVHLFYENSKWHKQVVGIGAQDMERFKGSGNVDAGKIGTDMFGYIATVEPFHGNVVAIYKKNFTSPTDIAWDRIVLDNFGVQDPKSFEGVGHHLLTGDFDGDCQDEFIVALRGPSPYQGVFYYDPVDVENGLFIKTRVSSESAARITLNDFNGDGKLDFATIGYAVKGYYENPNPQLWVFLNDF